MDRGDEPALRGDADDEFEPRRPAWVRPVAWVAIAALVVGGAFSSALTLLASGSASPDREATVVSDPIEERGRGSGTVAIEAPPEGATGLAVRFTCLSAGRFSWGIDPFENPRSTCTDPGVGSEMWNEFGLPETPTLYITADRDAEWEVLVVYVRRAESKPV